MYVKCVEIIKHFVTLRQYRELKTGHQCVKLCVVNVRCLALNAPLRRDTLELLTSVWHLSLLPLGELSYAFQ